ncbi:MAG TPA: AMP-binding protein, partial [Frankiaceae bacterium]|nr:AMP-binding protein [Frankiaceae bacterium]
KVHARVVATAEEEGGLRLRVFRWAFDVGGMVSRLRREGRRPDPLLAARHELADRLVFSRLRERFGGRVRYFVSGSAALSREIAEWFHAAGILILEGYGLTETSAATFLNRPDHYRFGTVGHPMPGAQVRLAQDGEICLRGPGVMRGYHNLPAQTAEVFEPEGWLRTGDVGEIDPEGFLRITDRKKELIKTSGGKYVAPQAIEVVFKGVCPIASQIVVHGDGRNYCTALVTLDADALEQWAHSRGIDEDDYAALTRRDEVHAYVGRCVADLNTRLNRWETIKDFRILDRDFSVEDGELTPSLKLKRKVVEARYRDTLDEMYAPVGAGAARAGH